ncbi:MAG: arylsulfatase [Sphingomonadaceae bacterium]
MTRRPIASALALACMVPLAGVPASLSAETTPAQQQEQKPNVLVWMLDDVGFAQLGPFGGLIETPNIDRVAAMGLRYTNYHTAPVCSAARAAFLSGRMPHSVNIGGHVAVARPVRGYTGHIPPSAGTIADNLGQAGYATWALGKWDHIPDEQLSPAGPFNQWPSGQGFERFYGFLAADTNLWEPTLVRDRKPVAPPAREDYHFEADMADEAIALIDQRRAITPSRPFLMYWATGTAHAPHHAPKRWIEHYKGRFDMGWDKAREQILARQKRAGIVPKDAELAPRPEQMLAWDTLSAEQRKLYNRQMEVFAAALSHADEQFGRILDALEARGELENTVVIVTSDNGASAEGNTHGIYTESFLGRMRAATLEENQAKYEDWGGPLTYPHYSIGWTVAGNTPLRYFKHATFEGGSRVPFVISWPKGIEARGETRRQFMHVSDVTPTIMDLVGVPLAERVNNVAQQPMEGTSFAYSFAAPKAPTRKGAQYFEMFGNKGFWQDGWTIVTRHRLEPWDMTTSRPITAPWELYDLSKDLDQSTDLAAKYPDRVAAMAAEFEAQAERFHVNPIGNISEGLAYTVKESRETFAARGGVWRYGGPVSHIRGPQAPPVAAMGFTMTATVEVPEGGASGPVFAAGGRLGGLSLYLDAGKPVLALRDMAAEARMVAADVALPAGTHQIELTMSSPDKSGARTVRIAADGRDLASASIPGDYMRNVFAYENFDLGNDFGSPVMPGAKAGAAYPGRLTDVTFDFRQPR